MVSEQEKRNWRMGMYLVLTVLAFTAACCFGGGIVTGWAVWH